MYCKFSLETISHLDKGMVRFVSKKLYPHNVPVKRKQIEQLILINTLEQKELCKPGK